MLCFPVFLIRFNSPIQHIFKCADGSFAKIWVCPRSMMFHVLVLQILLYCFLVQCAFIVCIIFSGFLPILFKHSIIPLATSPSCLLFVGTTRINLSKTSIIKAPTLNFCSSKPFIKNKSPEGPKALTIKVLRCKAMLKIIYSINPP